MTIELIFKPHDYDKARKISKTYENSYKCVACGTTDNLTKHHLIPRKKGGKGRKYNTVKMCRECHDDVHGFRTRKIKLTRLIKRYTKHHNTMNVYEISENLGIPTRDVVMIVYPLYWKTCEDKHQLRTMKSITKWL